MANLKMKIERTSSFVSCSGYMKRSGADRVRFITRTACQQSTCLIRALFNAASMRCRLTPCMPASDSGELRDRRPGYARCFEFQGAVSRFGAPRPALVPRLRRPARSAARPRAPAGSAAPGGATAQGVRSRAAAVCMAQPHPSRHATTPHARARAGGPAAVVAKAAAPGQRAAAERKPKIQVGRGGQGAAPGAAPLLCPKRNSARPADDVACGRPQMLRVH